MKIVHVITSLERHGAQMMLTRVLSGMDRRRFDSTVISLVEGGAMREQLGMLDVAVHSPGMKTSVPTPAAGLRLIRLLRRLQPDLVQGWMYHGNLAAQFGAMFLTRPTPVLWNIRGSSFELRREKPATAAIIWLGGKLSRLPHLIVNNSLSSAIKHQEHLGYRADRRAIIPNGFNTETFAPSETARLAVRRELKVDENVLLIGLIARYHPMKDHINFLRAAAILSSWYPQGQFVMAGEGVDRSNHDLCEALQMLILQGRVHLLGERSDVARVTAALDIATSASAFGEGFPNVIGEAMSCGVPCAATTVGDSAFIIGETGRVVPPGDSAALAAAWRELVEMGAIRRRELGAAARRRVIENFSINAIVRQYEDLYNGVLLESLSGFRQPKRLPAASLAEARLAHGRSQDRLSSQPRATEPKGMN